MSFIPQKNREKKQKCSATCPSTALICSLELSDIMLADLPLHPLPLPLQYQLSAQGGAAHHPHHHHHSTRILFYPTLLSELLPFCGEHCGVLGVGVEGCSAPPCPPPNTQCILKRNAGDWSCTLCGGDGEQIVSHSQPCVSIMVSRIYHNNYV